MAKIYRQIGALAQFIDELAEEGIGDFRTMDDIRSFHNHRKNSLNRIREKHGEILRNEVVALDSKYTKLSEKIDRKIKERETLLKNELEKLKEALARNEKRNMLMRLFFFFRKAKLTKRKKVLENSFDKEVRKPFRKGFEKLKSVKSEIEDKKQNAKQWIERYSADEIEQQERILSVFRTHRSLFYGAEGRKG